MNRWTIPSLLICSPLRLETDVGSLTVARTNRAHIKGPKSRRVEDEQSIRPHPKSERIREIP